MGEFFDFFEFGTNWKFYSNLAGKIFCAELGIFGVGLGDWSKFIGVGDILATEIRACVPMYVVW